MSATSRSDGKASEEVYGSAIERVVAAANEDARFRAVWIEGPSRADLRPPRRRLQIHVAADEPDFEAVLARIEAIVSGPSRLEGVRRSDVPRFARQIEGTLDGRPLTLIVEKTSLIPKRPRAAVASLVDKTGHLYHVMDFSLPAK